MKLSKGDRLNSPGEEECATVDKVTKDVVTLNFDHLRGSHDCSRENLEKIIDPPKSGVELG